MQKRKFQRVLSLALSALLILGDGSLLNVSAAGRTVSGSDSVSEQIVENQGTGQEEQTAQEQPAAERNQLPEVEKTEAGEVPSSVSGGDLTVSGNIPMRQPEAFHAEPVPEDYGVLAAYDEYSRTYRVDADQYITVLGNDGATYIEEDGSLQPVDNTLVENPVSTFSSITSGESYVNSANDYTVVLPGTMSAEQEAGKENGVSQDGFPTVSGNGTAGTVSGNDRPLPVFTGDSIVIDNGTHMLSLRPTEGLFAQGVVKDNAIRYNNVFENIDFQYTVLGNSVKEDIILLAPSERHSFSYLLDTYGLSARIENNTLYLTDGEETAFVLEAPEMEDAAGEISFGVRMELTRQDGKYLVTVTADQDWLSAPDRAYPVRIDPTAIQVTKSAIHVACAEEGSPNSVIGDNQYPYVGYDDGITSGNLAGFGSKHLNCRSYFAIDYDFSALAAEAEIRTAAFQVTQKTRWSKGTSEFGLYGVEEEWAVKKLTWNSQIGYTHYFLDAQTATTQRGAALTYDVTEEVSSWINGTSENHGLVMKAMVEAPNEAAAAAGVKMQSEVFYNNSSASYAPKLIISWTGELTDLDGLTLDDTTIDIYPVVERNGDKSCNALGVVAHGLAKPGSTVHYQLINGTTGAVEAAKTLKYPDSSEYAGAFPTALEYKRRLSNWQSEVFDNLTPGQEYYVTAYAEGLLSDPDAPGTASGTKPVMGVGATVTSDTFIIYEESALDLIPRIVEHYGVDLNTVMADNRMQDCLTKEGNRIFIRNPRNTSPYTSGNLSEYYRAMIDGLLLGRAENCEFGYEPINLNTGNFYMEQADATLADIGGDFALTRRYNSKGAAYKGSLGYGWSFAYDERLGELEDGSVIWLKNDGGIVTFTKDGEGYRAPAGCDVSLTEKEDGWVLTESASGLEHAFNVYGLLTALTDPQGNTTALAYDMDFNLLHITSPSGKQFGVALDGEKRISSVTLPDGYGVSYAYDAAGNLVQATDPAGDIRTYMYDDAHRMTGWVDENGHQVIGNVYDSEGRVVSQTDANGDTVTLSYEKDGAGSEGSTEAGGATTVTDPEGNTTVYHYDSRYRTTAIDYPDGTAEKRSYNGEGYLASVTDRTGVTVTYAYDGPGNLISETREDGAFRSYTYNEKNQLTSLTDYDGGKTRYGYDEKNRLISVTDAEGGVAVYAYDDSNRIVSATDPNGGVTAFTYDGACVTSMTDPEGGVWSYAYDAMNRQTGVTDPLGSATAKTYNLKGWCVSETDEAGAVTSYAFDKAGNVLSITDKEGQASTFTYDKKNRMLSGRDPLGNALAYTYDRNGNRRMEWDALGQETKYEYDSLNRLVSRTDPEGQTVTYTYNGHDRITGETDRRGYQERRAYDPVKGVVSSVTDKRGNVTAYETDACGRVIRVTCADGSTASYGYDKLGRMVSVTDQVGTTTLLSYDKNSNLISIQDDESRVYTYVYDRLNRLIQTTDPLGHEVTYTYDALGNVTAVTDERGNTTSYAYDAASRLTEMADALEGRSVYTYDKEDRVLTATAPGGDRITYTYDAIGQLLGVTDALGGVTTYTYDGLSRLTSITDALMGVTAYTYDRNGSLLTRTDALGNAHSYQVNAEGSLLTDRYPNGEKESYTYDANGNVLTCTDRYGVVTTFTYDAVNRITRAEDTAGNVMEYTYDAAGNLTGQKDVLGRTAAYVYDAFGRPVSVTGIDGVTTTYTYDALDRLVSVTDGEGKVTAYAYDAAGNLTHTTEPGKAEYAYTYDALNRLTEKIDPEGASTSFVYDRNSNLTEVTDGNGVKTSYAYDALNRLKRYTDGNGGRTAYVYDPLSRVTEITTPEGNKEAYLYDAVGNLTEVTDGLGQKTAYGYDSLYRLTEKTSPLGAVERYAYDSHDVVTGVTDALGAETRYEVNANGQVTRLTQANGGEYTYAYDPVHRLTKLTTPLGYEKQFTYSAGDDILTETDNAPWLGGTGRTTSYAYDVMHRMTAVTDPEGGVTRYAYDERGNRAAVTNALGYTYSYAYDRLDRMTKVTDPEEKATSIAYDAVGNVTGIVLPGERKVSYAYDNNYNRVQVTDPKGYAYGYAYDGDNRLTGTVDPLQQTTSYVYDAVNRVTAYTDKMGLSEGYVYDGHGNVLERTATDGLVTRYSYDLKDRLKSVTDPMGSTAYYTYDVMDNLIGVKDYMGRGSTYTYDLEGNLTGVTDASGRRESMTYDVAGRISSYTSNGGNRITYDYDKLNDLVEKSYSKVTGSVSDGDAAETESARPVVYAYNALGERIAMNDATGDTEYTYDGLGRLTGVTTYRTNHEDGSVNRDKGDTIGYAYDGEDNLSGITYPDGTKVTYAYDKNGNMTRVTDRHGKATSYEYDALNRVTEMHRPGGIATYNTYNARNQITELTNVCEHCGWVLSSYAYTYDDRGFIIGEVAKEARECDPYDRDNPYTPYRPEKLSKDCGHGKETSLTYRLVETARSFTYDDAGKLLSSTETVTAGSGENCGTSTWDYAYDLMGNRISEIRRDAKGTVVENNHYVYNDSNQMVQAKLCDGKKTICRKYTYDADGNLVEECSPDDPGLKKTYEYTVENRLAAVYDAHKLLMAAAYDGDGNRVFMLNYNPEKDEDFTGYYQTYQNKDYKGTGVLFPVCEEVGEAEQELLKLIKDQENVKYELIEYLTDVNREYAEVLVEQNLNGRTDTTYTYGVDRISKELFDCESYTSYYLYDPRGSVTGLTNWKGQLCKTYQYDSYGELTRGKEQYENAYTYNGESYNPNIETLYLRARYYSVVTANFLTEDSYLGKINEPLTLNRYSYCLASPLNYVDPSGHIPVETILDLVFIGMDAVELWNNPSWGNAGWLALDIAGALIPYMPGSYAFKGAKGAVEVAASVDEAGHTVIAAYHAIDVAHGIYQETKLLDTSISAFQLVDKAREMNALMNTADLAYDAYRITDRVYDAYRVLNVANEARRGLEAGGYIGKMAQQVLLEYAQSDLCGAEGKSKPDNPEDYLNEALERQGLDKTPKNMKESWTADGYKYEVRVHEANLEYGKEGSIYRVSRKKLGTNANGQGYGTEYLDTDGVWHHTSTLKPQNPNYNAEAAANTHISVPE